MSPLGAPTTPVDRAGDEPSGWNRTISELEQALGTGDAAAVAKVAVDVSLGKVPSHLEGRARTILEEITGMESEVMARRAEVQGELARLGGRSRFAPLPAPGHLDCSA